MITNKIGKEEIREYERHTTEHSNPENINPSGFGNVFIWLSYLLFLALLPQPWVVNVLHQDF
jgi:hypothetical protein